MDNAPPTTHRISEFYKLYKEKRLNYQPIYQRKPVWPQKNKSYLIDTILNGLPVPEVYVQVKTDFKGNTKYDMVDGQQRMRSIVEFIDGEFSVAEDEETVEYRGKWFSDLSDDDKKNFWDYPLVVRELRTNKNIEVTGIFKRLNKNVVPLNQQEMRHATYSGDFIKLVDHLAERDFWFANKIVNPENIRRMKDAEFVSEILVGIMDGPQDGTKLLEKYYKIYDTDFSDKEEWEKNFTKTQQMIEDIFGNLNGTHWNSKSDFYSLFLSLSSLLKNHLIPIDKFGSIKEDLLEFRRRVNLEKDASNDVMVRQYSLTLEQATAKKETRLTRIDIIKKLFLPYVISKDPKRIFTEEQRQYIWDTSEAKLCVVCNQKVEFNNYAVDHIVPHSKGGLTIISNGAVIHRKPCNSFKGNRQFIRRRNTKK